MTNYLILGGSGGLGALLCQYLPSAGDRVWIAARTEPSFEFEDGVERVWIEVDLGQRGAGAVIAAGFGHEPLDMCLYHADIADLDVLLTSGETMQSATERLVALHLTSAIMCVQKLMPNLRRSRRAKVVLMGAPPLPSAGIAADPDPLPRFGLKSVSNALRQVVRRDRISVTCLYIGEVAITDSARDEADDVTLGAVSPTDLIMLIRCLTRLSRSTSVKEIDLSAMLG